MVLLTPSGGSSPHMRGTLATGILVILRAGIIPAYAGNTVREELIRRPSRDHPRICGEHCSDLNVTGLAARIIPAYAGNTQRLTSKHWPPRDHPRICGEHQERGHTVRPSTGSSPHMRGTPYACALLVWTEGIIPAYAGNTVINITSYFPNRDHPRICGEHSK